MDPSALLATLLVLWLAWVFWMLLIFGALDNHDQTCTATVNGHSVPCKVVKR